MDLFNTLLKSSPSLFMLQLLFAHCQFHFNNFIDFNDHILLILSPSKEKIFPFSRAQQNIVISSNDGIYRTQMKYTTILLLTHKWMIMVSCNVHTFLTTIQLFFCVLRYFWFQKSGPKIFLCVWWNDKICCRSLDLKKNS